MSAVLERVDPAMALAAAHDALDALARVDLTACSEDELLELMREGERLRRRLPSVEHRLLLETETRGLPGKFSCRSSIQFLRALLRLDPVDAAARVRAAAATGSRRALTGEALPSAYPEVAAAQADGSISERHAALIVKTIEKLPDVLRDEHGAQVETDLVGYARQFAPRQLEQLAARIRGHLDPDGTLDDVEQRRKHRGVDLHQRPDGSAKLDGELTAECAELLRLHFDALAGPKPGADGAKDPRTATQRRHDALLDALKLVVRAQLLPQAAGMTATLIVTMTDAAYRTGTGLARTAHGAWVPTKEALSWGGGDMRLMAVVMNRVKGIIGYSSLQRCFTEQQRLAMHARDGGCTFPACDAPPSWCEAHHLTDYQHTGHTRVDDGGLVCGFDHDERIRQGWTTQLIDGRVAWIPPRWIDPERKPQYNELHHPGGGP